jgi:hypothetical protein
LTLLDRAQRGLLVAHLLLECGLIGGRSAVCDGALVLPRQRIKTLLSRIAQDAVVLGIERLRAD